MKNTQKSFWKDILLLTVLIGVFFGFMLGNRPLSAPDEGRYTEIPREMAVTGDFITPRLNGVKYFEKPPLLYWLNSFSIKAFGVQEWAVRFWPAFLGLLGCLGIYGAGRRLYGREAGFVSALVLATSLLYYAHSRIVILDMGVSVFITFSLLSYLLAVRSPPGNVRIFYLSGFFLSMALSILCKGLIGVALPGLILILWSGFLRDWTLLRPAFTPWGILLFLVVAMPWHILAALKNPEFPYFYFVHEHFLRYLTKVHHRYQPVWFFMPILLVGLFPWVSFLGQSLWFSMKKVKQNLKEEKEALLLLIWPAVIFLFFSLSSSKLIPYILPCIPPLALLIGRYLTHEEAQKNLPQGIKIFMVLSGVLILALPIGLKTQDMEGDMALRPYVYAILAILASGSALVYWVGRKRGIKASLVTLVGVSVAFLWTLNGTWPLLDNRSVKSFAIELNRRLKPDDSVVAYHSYYQDLPPYIGRTIYVVQWTGELAFGMSVEKTTKNWMIEDEEFLKLWMSPKRVYMVTRKDIFKDLQSKGVQNLTLIGETERDVLVVNQP